MIHCIVIVDNVGKAQQQGRASLQRFRSITQLDDDEVCQQNDPETSSEAHHVGRVFGREKKWLAAVASTDGSSCPTFG